MIILSYFKIILPLKNLIINILEIQMKRKLAEEDKRYEQVKKEVEKKKLKNLLGTDCDDLEELQRLRDDLRNEQLQKIKEDKKAYEKALQQKPMMLGNQVDKIHFAGLTDISIPNNYKNRQIDKLCREFSMRDAGGVGTLFHESSLDTKNYLYL